MSNKIKGVKKHNNNILTSAELRYNSLVKQCLNYARKWRYSNHIGSKTPNKLKLMIWH